MFKKMLFTVCISILSISAFASHYTNGYMRQDGTYVQGHESMNPYESQGTGMSYHHDQLEPRRDRY